MKKFLLTLFLIILLIPASASAFEPPDSSRWFWVNSDDSFGVWVDMQTLKYNTEYNRYSPCNGHRFVTVWELWYSAEDNTNSRENKVYDLDCRTVKILSSYIYDDNGKIISSDRRSSLPSTIVPGTWGEILMEFMDFLWDVDRKYKQKEAL